MMDMYGLWLWFQEKHKKTKTQNMVVACYLYGSRLTTAIGSLVGLFTRSHSGFLMFSRGGLQVLAIVSFPNLFSGKAKSFITFDYEIGHCLKKKT